MWTGGLGRSTYIYHQRAEYPPPGDMQLMLLFDRRNASGTFIKGLVTTGQNDFYSFGVIWRLFLTSQIGYYRAGVLSYFWLRADGSIKKGPYYYTCRCLIEGQTYSVFLSIYLFLTWSRVNLKFLAQAVCWEPLGLWYDYTAVYWIIYLCLTTVHKQIDRYF